MNSAQNAANGTNKRRSRRVSIAFAVIAYLAPIALTAVDQALSATSSKRISGAILYYEIVFAIGFIMLAAFTAALSWRRRTLLALIGIGLLILEVLVIGVVLVTVEGLTGIQ